MTADLRASYLNFVIALGDTADRRGLIPGRRLARRD
jgi:hypothetical protein